MSQEQLKRRGRPAKNLISEPLPDLNEPKKRRRVLNNIASRKCRKLRRLAINQNIEELKAVEDLHRKLTAKVNRLAKAVSILKPLCHVESVHEVWRPWLNITKCFIAFKKPID